MDAARLETKIREFLRRELDLDDAQIDGGTALVTTGLVDSAALVRLAALLEEETGVAIPDRDVGFENFESIDRILGYLRERGSA